MSRWLARTALLLLALAASACPEQPQPSPAAPDAALAVQPTPPTPPDLRVTARFASADGGLVDIPFAPGARPLIESTQTLEVSSNLALSNVRIRVFDEADRAMVSDDEILDPAEPDSGSLPGVTGYRIHFLAPLKTGHRYTLVVDAQSGATFSDSEGRAQLDQRLEFQVAGEKEKPAPPKVKKPVRRRR